MNGPAFNGGSMPQTRGVRAAFFDAGFTLLFPARPVVDLYLEAARSVSPGHCETRLRDAFHRAWGAGTRDGREDHRSSDEIERARWHRFTRKIAEEVPGLLPHHDAWMERLTSAFDSGGSWTLAPEVPGVLARLRARGVKVGIVSNWHSGLHRIVDEVGLAAMVDFVVCSATIGFRKPHPAIFHRALEECGEHAAAAVHVGDTWAEDVVGAHAVGITPIHLAKDAASRAQGSHRTIADLTEVEGLI